MQRRTFERKLQGQVDIDLCFACRGIWFDAYESAQLAPGAVIALFEAVHEGGTQPARPLASVPRCPACRGALALTHDLQRTTRFTYYRCEAGDGRFTTFYQFLREKSFVRELTPPEVSRLRATVAQVRCSSCGAPIDLARDAACGYCHMPLAMLDPDAVKTALAELARAEDRRHEADPTAPMQAVLAGQRMERRLAAVERGGGDPWTWNAANLGLGADLVSAAIGFLMSD